MRVLVTGGAGYIGSHACVALGEQGYCPVVFDNLCNSSSEAVRRASAIIGLEIPFVEADVRDHRALVDAMRQYDVGSVIHLAALKSVGESVVEPLAYFDNNISGTIALLQAMRVVGVNNLVFSSSATVYGNADKMPVGESSPTSVTNPYGRSKLVMEQLVGDLCSAASEFGALLLRYFNPVGAHESGLIGEDPRGSPNNLMPFLAQVAVRRRERLNIFGGDWPTRDGTGVRDYIHVMDLARAHVAGLRYLQAGNHGALTLNIGTGRGTTVLELVQAFARVSGRPVSYEIVDRRPGDVAELWADTTLAERTLFWRAEYDVDRMCEDTWRWQSQNPYGYS